MKKNLIRLVTVFFLSSLFFSACKREEYTLGEAESKKAAIQGTWTLYKVVQKDEITCSDRKTLDVSSIFLGANPMTIKFDNDNIVITPGTTPNLFGGTSGTWVFNNDQFPNESALYPEYMTFNFGGGNTQKAYLSKTVRSFDKEMKVKWVRFYNGKAAVSYEFVLNRP